MFGFGSRHYTRSELLDLLRANVCEVTFTKVSDGSERVMKATLNTLFLPEYKQSDKTMVGNPDVVRVYDVELNDWRSFRADSVKNVVAVTWPQNVSDSRGEPDSDVVDEAVSAVGSLLSGEGSDPVLTSDSEPVVVGGGGTFDGGGSEGSWSNDSDSGSSDSSSSSDSGGNSSSSDPVDTSSGDNTDDF